VYVQAKIASSARAIETQNEIAAINVILIFIAIISSNKR
jgi:hypothetical protein